MELINKFGHGKIISVDEMIFIEHMQGRPMIYCESSACLSVTSDAWSWVSSKKNRDRVVVVTTNSPGSNNVIIVLGCQITDLAILNDIKLIEKLHADNPKARMYVGGCLAYRFDIELPEYVTRLATMREINVSIDKERAKYIQWQKPFWVTKDSWENGDKFIGDGRLFRDMHPIKIGTGCTGNCKYCNIKDTRGDGYSVDPYLQVGEFINAGDVVLISDNPTKQQMIDWCHLSKRYNKPISIRNVEPSIAVQCKDEFLELAELGLLKVFHCPIQSNNTDILKAMNRDVDRTIKAIDMMIELRKNGVITATNIIIDYPVEENGEVKIYNNFDTMWLNNTFDYWTWNPYFDGKWDRENAERRFGYYLPGNTDSQSG